MCISRFWDLVNLLIVWHGQHRICEVTGMTNGFAEPAVLLHTIRGHRTSILIESQETSLPLMLAFNLQCHGPMDNIDGGNVSDFTLQ